VSKPFKNDQKLGLWMGKGQWNTFPKNIFIYLVAKLPLPHFYFSSLPQIKTCKWPDFLLLTAES
jgi:hypothetical protein